MKQKFANAFSLALIVAMLFTSVGLADQITADADVLVANNQASKDLGTVAPGAVVSTSVSFILECNGNKHVDDAQTVVLAFSLANSTVPSGGSLTATGTSIGAQAGSDLGIPSSWPDDGTNCPATPPTLGDNGDSAVTITAPSAGGFYTYIVAYTRNIGSPDISGGNSVATFTLTVPSNTATTTTVSNASATYGDASVTLSATISPNPGGGSISFSVDGSPAGSGTVDASGVAAVSYNPGSLNAGSHTIQASFGGFGTFLASSGSGTLSIGQASSTTTVTCGVGPFTYTGSAQTPCSASVTGAGGLSQPLSLSYSNNTNAGTATASASYAGDTNHTGSSDTENFSIGQASSTTTVICQAGPFTYDGTAKEPCSASFSTSDGLSGPLAVGYANNINAGTAIASASYTGDANHAGSNDTENFTIGKAATTTTVICTAGPFTYNGLAQEPCSASVTGPNGLNETLTVAYQNNVNAGQATASASYAESNNYLGSSDTENFIIGKATTTTTVICTSGPFTYNGLAQEPCSATVTGAGDLNESVTVTYANNVNAGTASASATYVESDNYLGSSDTENFIIGKATTTTTVTCGAGPFTYNGLAQEPCSATVTGAGGLDESVTVIYANNVNAGNASASATYAESANYLGSSDSENFSIDKATLTVKADNKTITFGQSLPTFTFQYIGFVNGENASVIDTAPTCSVGSIPMYGTYPIVCSGGSDNNYAFSFVNGTLTIQPWTYGGFYQPVDTGNVLNVAKNGSTVPLKFEVFAGGTELTTVASIKQSFVQTLTCGTGVALDDIENYATGGTSLRYDTTSGQFIFNWQTPRTPGACYRVTLTLLDGTTISANFKLK